jgi:hypothetical protein
VNCHDAHPGPLPTLADRLRCLNDSLLSLAARLKDAIASTVGNAVSQAVRDLVRSLLGQREYARPDDRPWPGDFDDQRDAESSIGFDAAGRGFAEDEEVFHQGGRRRPGCDVLPEPAAPARRWPDALRAAVQAGLCWVRDRPLRRPGLTAVLVGLAAGGTALVVGPAVAACLSVAASLASMLLTSDSARSIAEFLGGLAG